jgi:hypothetical protein
MKLGPDSVEYSSYVFLQDSNPCFEENLIDSGQDKFFIKSDYHFPPNSLRILPILNGQKAVAITFGSQSGNFSTRRYLPTECELIECY